MKKIRRFLRAHVVLAVSALALLTPAGMYAARKVAPTGCSALTITSISPTSGSTAGGTLVTITGTGFAGGITGVTIGGEPVTSIVVVNNTTLTGISPAHSADTEDVVVTNACGSATLPSSFTFVVGPAAVPTLSGIMIAVLAFTLALVAFVVIKR